MADKKKKENFFVRSAKGIAQYAKATKSELKKVSWPTRKQLINNTAIVIVCVVIVSVVIFVLDIVFGKGFEFLIGRKTAEPQNDIPNVQEMSTEDATAFNDDLNAATEDASDEEASDEDASDEDASNEAAASETESAAE